MDQEELVRRAFDAFNSEDVEWLRRNSTPDLRIVPLRAALEDTAYEGPGAIDEFWAAGQTAWTQQRVDLEHVESSGDQVTAKGVLSATARESGAQVKTTATWTVTVRDGLIAEIRTETE